MNDVLDIIFEKAKIAFSNKNSYERKLVAQAIKEKRKDNGYKYVNKYTIVKHAYIQVWLNLNLPYGIKENINK